MVELVTRGSTYSSWKVAELGKGHSENLALATLGAKAKVGVIGGASYANDTIGVELLGQVSVATICET